MPSDTATLVHAVVFLLFVAAGLAVSLALALVGGLPWFVVLAPALASLLAGHLVAARLVVA